MYMEKSYQTERENREKRLSVYSERIQEYTLSQSKQIIEELVEERHRQNMTQQEIADITEWDLNRVKVNLHRARKKLKEQLIKDNAYDTS